MRVVIFIMDALIILGVVLVIKSAYLAGKEKRKKEVNKKK